MWAITKLPSPPAEARQPRKGDSSVQSKHEDYTDAFIKCKKENLHFWNVTSINHPENQYKALPETQQNGLKGPLSVDISDLSNLSRGAGWLLASGSWFQFCPEQGVAAEILNLRFPARGGRCDSGRCLDLPTE